MSVEVKERTRPSAGMAREPLASMARDEDGYSILKLDLGFALVVIDEIGTVEAFNSGAELQFGYEAGEIIGQNVKMLMPEPYKSGHDGYLRHHLQTGEKKIIGSGREITGLRKDGTEFPMVLSVGKTKVGGIIKFVGLIEDVTKRVEADNVIRDQHAALNELSTPAINIWEGIVLMPLVGNIDTARASQITEKLLEAITQCRADVAILDITGVPILDTSTANHLFKCVTASKMLGSEVILTGFKPESAQTLVGLGVDLSEVRTKGSLLAGLEEAFRMTGLKISKTDAR